MDNDRWLTDAQVEEMTQRKKQTLRNDRCLGRGIPYSKFGRLVRYKMSDVVAFMKACRVEPQPLEQGVGK